MSDRPKRQRTVRRPFDDDEDCTFVLNQQVMAPWNGQFLPALIIKLLPSNFCIIRYEDNHEREIKQSQLKFMDAITDESPFVVSETVEMTILDDTAVSEDHDQPREGSDTIGNTSILINEEPIISNVDSDSVKDQNNSRIRLSGTSCV